MYADKVIGYFDIHVEYQFKHYIDLDVFLWTTSQTLAVLLLVVAFFFKPYKWSLVSPLVVFSMQLMYVWRDEEWIQHEYYFLYTTIFVITILATIYFIKYMVIKIGSALEKSKKKDVDTLVNFVVEVHNEHYAKILKSANSLEVLHEFDCSAEEKYTLRQILKRELQTGSKQFEVRLIQTFHKLDD
ncbi:hypothetical protein [Flagellimonas sp.]|uniref:hypothetical protein n=1 Tax=Flagellimonas sp. TaxID=2058762 RepID=UPI003F49FBF6